MMTGESAERIHPPSPSKREQVVSEGHGPRASWLASFLGIVFFIALASVVAPMWIASLVSTTKKIFSLAPTQQPAQLFTDAITPALWIVVVALVGAILAHIVSHGAWIRMGPWKMRQRTTIVGRFLQVIAGVFVAIATMGVSLTFALPWLKNISNWSSGSLTEVVWSSLGMIGMTALGAAITLLIASIMQRFKARNAFESSIRMTRAQAREAARESGEGRANRRPQSRSTNRTWENRN